MLFADVVVACRDVAAAPKRDGKVAALTDLLNATTTPDLEAVVAFTTGVSRHARAEVDTAEFADVRMPPAAEQSTLTVRAVDRSFNRLGSLSGGGANDARRQLLVDLYRRATQEEQVFIASVVDGTGRLAVPATLMTTAIARAAGTRVREVQRAMTVAGSLHAAARVALRDGSEGLSDAGVEPMWPVDLMRVSVADDVVDALGSAEAATVERRLNGVRIQAHRRDKEVQLFLRDLDEVTDRFPTVVNAIRAFPGGDFVLDGEIIALDAAGRPIDGLSMLGEEVFDDDVQVRPFFFDVLYLDRTIIDEPLARRRELMSTVVPTASRVASIETTDPAEARRFLAEARRWGYEGIVVKDLASTYAPGRRSRSWRQVKPVHTLDLVVLGAEWGTGRRRRYLSTIHLGARDSSGGYVMVGKATKGLTDQMLRWQTARFRDLQVSGGDDDDGRVVHVRPEQVVEVAVDGVNPSVRYPGGVSLRFARVRQFRRDTDPAETDSIEAVRALMSLNGDDPVVTRFGDRSAAESVADAGAPTIGLPPREVAHARRVDVAAPHYESVIPRSLQDIGVGGRRVVDDIDFDFPPYQDPELLRLERASWGVLVTRALALMWVLAVTIAAFVLRSEPNETGRTVDVIGWAGVGVAFLLAVAGWWWSDRRTRNLHRLDGRWPSRLRCATAWLSPLAMAVALWGTLVQLNPSELFDVRPPIITVLFAIAMWRPYSLVRRIFATLIRVRFDPLIGAAFVLDLMSFGLIWWRLTDWPPPGQRPGSGELETMIGVGAAVSLAMLLNLLMWVLLLQTGVKAEAHRAASQRTRYEHRMLRLRNVDPTDPEVWWALVQRRADEQRQAERDAEMADRPGGALFVDDTEIPTGEMFVEAVQRNHRVALQRLGKTESAVVLDRLREKFAVAIAEAGIDVRHPLDDVLDDVGVKSVAADLETRAPVEQTPELEAPAVESVLGRLRAAMERAALLGEPDLVLDGSLEPAQATLKDRLGVTAREETVRSSPLEQLLEQAGQIHIEAALAERRREADSNDLPRMVPPKLYLLEAARGLLLIALAATVATAVWLVSRTVSASAVADLDELRTVDVIDIERARRSVFDAFSLVVVLAPLWAFAVAAHARRCDSPFHPEKRTFASFLGASAFTVLAFVVDGDGRGTTTLLLLLPAAVLATFAVLSLAPSSRWFDLRATTLLLWPAGIPLVLVVVAMGRLHESIVPTASLQGLTFFAIVVALLNALAVTVAASSTVDFEDAIRLSPVLAIPARTKRRKRRRDRRWS